MSSNACRTVLFPEPESPVKMTSWRDSRVERGFTIGSCSTLDPPLMRAGDTHIFAIFCHGPPRDANARILELFRNLVVGQRLRSVFFIDHLFYKPLQREQRHSAALRPIHCFAEKRAQFQHA